MVDPMEVSVYSFCRGVIYLLFFPQKNRKYLFFTFTHITRDSNGGRVDHRVSIGS